MYVCNFFQLDESIIRHGLCINKRVFCINNLLFSHPSHCNQTAFRATGSGTESIEERGSKKHM